jgi:hypothetical protein
MTPQMRPDRLSEVFGDVKVVDIIDRCGTNEKITVEFTKRTGVKVKREQTSTSPGFLDSIIILLVSAALVIFLLWATSRTQGLGDTFEHLPDWLRDSYRAIWASVVTGATGIGLLIVKGFKEKGNPRPNYLLYILGTTVLLLLLIFFLPKVFRRPDDLKTYVETDLNAGGFEPSFMNHAPQMPGSRCGQDRILFTPGKLDVPSSAPNSFSGGMVKATVGQWNSVQWDASYICRRQGIKGGVDGKVFWDTPNHDFNRLPTDDVSFGEWGTLKFKYLVPGRYTVKMDLSTTCRADSGEPDNECRAAGEFDVQITKP